MASVEIESEEHPFRLTLNAPDKNRKLWIVEPENFGQGAPMEAQNLVRTLALAHLIAPFLPEIIETNFAVEATEILNGLYEHYRRNAPIIRKKDPQLKIKNNFGSSNPCGRLQHATATSGGADSAYRITELIRRGEGVVGIHVQNLNKSPKGEAEASERQCRTWNVAYEKIRLLNSSGNSGYQTMRSRDLLIAGLCIVASSPYRVKDIQIEGGMINSPESCNYSEYLGAWENFNKVLNRLGIKVQVVGVGPGEIETIGELIKIENETGLCIIPLIQNCFSAPYQLPNNRRKWERETPATAGASSEHWCGSCYKCRRVTLGRLYYHDPRLEKVPEKEITFFIKDTRSWIKMYPNHCLLSGNFTDHLNRLAGALP